MNQLSRSFLLACGAYFLMVGTFAQPSDYKHDLVNCRFNNGIAMDQVECQAMRKYFAAQAAKKAKDDAYMAKELAALEGDRLLRKENEDKRKAEWAEMRAKEKIEQEARQAVYAKQREAEDRAQASADRKAAVAASDLKARCGKDYKAPYIGMALARAQECVTPMKLEGQLNGPNGIISTYRGGGGSLFQSIDGRIVYWHK